MVKSKPAARRKTAKAQPQTRRRKRVIARAGGLTLTEVSELRELRRELERVAGARTPPRWNADPDDVQKSVARLVLTLAEFIRRILERQAIRRLEAGTLSEQQTEDVGHALMNLEAAIADIAAKFGLQPDDLNLDLGPVGRLM